MNGLRSLSTEFSASAPSSLHPFGFNCSSNGPDQSADTFVVCFDWLRFRTNPILGTIPRRTSIEGIQSVDSVWCGNEHQSVVWHDQSHVYAACSHHRCLSECSQFHRWNSNVFPITRGERTAHHSCSISFFSSFLSLRVICPCQRSIDIRCSIIWFLRITRIISFVNSCSSISIGLGSERCINTDRSTPWWVLRDWRDDQLAYMTCF